MTGSPTPRWHDAVLGMSGITGPTSFLCAPQARRNIDTQAEMAAANNAVVVPHFKGHRLRALAEYQLATGSPGIEASKLTDIISLHRMGLRCSFTLSWCWNRPVTWGAAAALAVDGADLTVDVDSRDLALGYAAAATKRGVTIGVRVQVDSGLRGIDPAQAIDLARIVISTPGLQLTALTAYRGVYTRDRNYNSRPAVELGREEGELITGLASELSSDTAALSLICGSTLTSHGAASVPGVTGVSGGTYALGDMTQSLLGFTAPEAVAVATLTTILETDGDVATVDAGLRTFGTFSHYPADIPGIVHSATRDRQIVLVDADAATGRVKRADGPPLVRGQRVLLLPGNASAFSAEHGATVVVDDSGTITDSWARVTNDMRIDDVLI